MIDTFIRLLEKTTEYVKLRQDRAGRTVDLIITPMFTDLKSIHEDYIQMFVSCRRDLAAGVPLAEIARKLLSDRIEKEALRLSVIAFAENFTKDKRLHEYHSFFNSVSRYLYGPTFGRGSTRSVQVLCILRYAAGEDTREGRPEDRESQRYTPKVVEELDKILKSLRQGWKAVSKEYAALLAKRVTQ